MAEESKGRSVALLFVGGFIVLIILAVGLYLIKLFFFTPPQPLPDNSFVSHLEQRFYYDKKLKRQVTYWVIASKNQTKETYYDCRFQVTAKGTEEIYDGFLKDYTERECFQYNMVKDNYDCRLTNWWNRTFNYGPARTLRKFSPNMSWEIAVSHFHQKETRPNLSFLGKNQLTDIYSYTISCKTSPGRSVTHTQQF